MQRAGNMGGEDAGAEEQLAGRGEKKKMYERNWVAVPHTYHNSERKPFHEGEM